MAAVTQNQLWLALRLPFLQLEAIGVDLDDAVVVVSGPRRRISAATRCCLEEGVVLGMPAATANLMTPCKVLSRDKARESTKLSALCDVLYAFTPYIKHYCPDPKNDASDQGLLLELSRCLHLFEGIDALLKKILASLSQFGLAFKYARSQSAYAAWLLSFYPVNTEISVLPCLSLDAFPKEAEALSRMGFETLTDVQQHVFKQGWFALQKRFSPEFIGYLAEIVGNSEPDSQQKTLFLQQKPPEIYQPDEQYFESFDFEFPATCLQALEEPMQLLLQGLIEYLQRKQLQCDALTWRFQDIYKHTESICLSFERVHQDWRLIYDLSQIQMERRGLPFEVDQVALCKPSVSPCVFDTEVFTLGNIKKPSNSKALQLSTARLQARLGEKNVLKLSYCDDPLPEQAQKYIAVSDQVDSKLQAHHRYASRPAWILNNPVHIGDQQNNLRWNGRLHLLKGPERIEGHWWDTPTARDYFVAVRDDHVRLWIFHDLHKKTWFVQGVF